MNAKPLLTIFILVGAALIGVALLAQGQTTGQAINSFKIPTTNGAVLSAFAAVVAIAVLIVAGLQKSEPMRWDDKKK